MFLILFTRMLCMTTALTILSHPDSYVQCYAGSKEHGAMPITLLRRALVLVLSVLDATYKQTNSVSLKCHTKKLPVANFRCS